VRQNATNKEPVDPTGRLFAFGPEGELQKVRILPYGKSGPPWGELNA